MTSKMYLIAVLLISTYSLFGQKPMEEDPNVMWTYQNSFHSFPSVHPNGNVLIRSHYDVLEINGLTGELIRRIYVPVAGVNTDRISISQDGTRFMVRGCLVDYESGKVLKQGLPYLVYSFLHPANDKIIYAKKGYSLAVLDLGDNSETEYMIWPNNQFSITSLAVSNDGRFFAMSGRDFEDEYNTYFDLFDAKTIKPIRQLEKVKAEGRTIEFIQFSENAKYVGYGQYTGGTPKATFFSSNPPYTKKEFGVQGIGFIQDNYAFLTSPGSPLFSIIWDINEEKEIYKTFNYGSYNPLYNKTYNSIILNGLVSLDFNKILTGVGVDDPKEPLSNFNSEYRKGILAISNYKSVTGIVNIEIVDIQGNIMLSTVYSSITDYGRIEIPVNLTKSVYVLKLQDGKQNYSQKFLVVE